MKEELKYMKGCTLCDEGMAERMEELIEGGQTVNKASKSVAEEVEGSMGYELFKPNAIRHRYRKVIGQDNPDHKKKVGPGGQQSKQKQVEVGYDTIGVSSLEASELFGLDLDGAEWISKGALDTLYRALAKQLHPDKQGGSGEMMTHLGKCKERVEQRLKIV